MKLALVCAFVCSSLLLPLHCLTQEPAKPASDTAKKENPIKSSPTSIASGKKKYSQDCAMCHGNEGGGDGDLAADMHLKLRDLRDPDALKDLSDADIFAIINNGKGKMMGEEGRLKPDEIWDVVNYLRSIAKK